MLQHLAKVLRAERERVGAIQIDVAARLGLNRSAISRFETDLIVPEVGLDELVDAYAQECGVGWLALWELAMAEARATHRA
jgi:transcriptional regulator with XRE-family HTH domain